MNAQTKPRIPKPLANELKAFAGRVAAAKSIETVNDAGRRLGLALERLLKEEDS